MSAPVVGAVSHRGRKLFVFGSSGTGKTTFATEYIKGEIADGVEVFVFDFKQEFAARLNVPLEQKTSDMIKEFPIHCTDASAIWEGNIEGGLQEYCDFVYGVIQMRPMKRKLIVLDDAQMMLSNYVIGGGLAKLFENGRRYRADILCISQGANSLHNRLRNQATDIVSFRTIDLRAKEFLISLGFPEGLDTLKRGHFWIKSLETGEVRAGDVSLSRK